MNLYKIPIQYKIIYKEINLIIILFKIDNYQQITFIVSLFIR